jgi:hypothetical protein
LGDSTATILLLRDVRYGIRADTTDPIAQAVKASNLAPIIRAFDVKAYGKDKAPVIDVTDLFKKDVPELSARRALGAGAMDSARSFIEDFKAFPQNINVRVLASLPRARLPAPIGHLRTTFPVQRHHRRHCVTAWSNSRLPP